MYKPKHKASFAVQHAAGLEYLAEMAIAAAMVIVLCVVWLYAK